MTNGEASGPVEALKAARENFVRKRRAMAEQMAPAGAAAAHFAPAFVDLQAAIEALDRAIRDEESLPPGYAAEAAREAEPEEAAGSNVEFVDFETQK